VTDEPAGIQIPEDLPDDPKEAYLLGVEHTAARIGGGAMALAEAVADYDGGEDGEGREVCEECGGNLVDDFGGMRCAQCGHQSG